MKVAVIQPLYSTDFSRADELFDWETDALDKCDESLDLIVLPESADHPVLSGSRQNYDLLSRRFCRRMMDKAKETAVRCNAMVFYNGMDEVDGKPRNTTFAINRKGEVVGKYYKQHLTHSEVFSTKLDSEYTFDYEPIAVVEMEGIRFAFLVCYDFYFYETFPAIARQNVDVIIGCSHQRSDSLDALEIIDRFLCYNTNAYLVRSSVSMGEDSPVGGGSMIVAPDGKILVNMGMEVGMATAEFDPHAKFFKPAGFQNPPSAHWEYIDKGRRPWKYRPAGSAIARTDEFMTGNRVCAQGGAVCAPAYSMAAFGAAIGMGADEIGFPVFFTRDGVAVTVASEDLSACSNGGKKVSELSFKEVCAYDFGQGRAGFDRLAPTKTEDVFRKFAALAIFNVQVSADATDEQIQEIARLIFQYDCEKHAYVTCSHPAVLRKFKQINPKILTCLIGSVAQGEDKAWLQGEDVHDKKEGVGYLIECNDRRQARAYWQSGVQTVVTTTFDATWISVKSL